MTRKHYLLTLECISGQFDASILVGAKSLPAFSRTWNNDVVQITTVRYLRMEILVNFKK